MPRNYVGQGKAIHMDQPESLQARADCPLQVAHFDRFGLCKHSSFAGNNCCVVLVDNHARYPCVYTVKNKSDLTSSRNFMLTLQLFVESILYVGFVEKTMQVKTFQQLF